jgi:hypothetical protein
MHRYILTLPEPPHPTDDAALRRGVKHAAQSATCMDATLELAGDTIGDLTGAERLVLVEVLDGYLRLITGLPATSHRRSGLALDVVRAIREKIRATL